MNKKEWCEAWARKAWDGFMDTNMKNCLRFGMVDVRVLRWVTDQQAEHGMEVDERHEFLSGPDFTLALMACAKADGGMVV